MITGPAGAPCDVASRAHSSQVINGKINKFDTPKTIQPCGFLRAAKAPARVRRRRDRATYEIADRDTFLACGQLETYLKHRHVLF